MGKRVGLGVKTDALNKADNSAVEALQEVVDTLTAELEALAEENKALTKANAELSKPVEPTKKAAK